MEVDELSKGVKIGLLINFNVSLGDVVKRIGYYTPQVLFESFVVRKYVISCLDTRSSIQRWLTSKSSCERLFQRVKTE